MTKAYAYVRFSSEKQSSGSSAERQIERARKYALEHGLELDDKTYQDLGVSGYRGRNAVEGKLGVFIDAVERGIIPKGSYLLVENFDRMSRNVITEAQALLLNLVNRGIVVVTLLDGQVFSKERLDREDGAYAMILAVLEMIRANGESKRKADLVTKGWERAREKKPIITRMAPAWLSTADGKNWIVNVEKVKVIERIFDMALSGMGTPSIERVLNAEGVQTFRQFDDPGRESYWTAGTVSHVLKNQAVIGVLETKKISRREGYYPQIIKPEVFFRVQGLMAARNFAPGAKPMSTIVNLFAGRSYCGRCGAKMKTVSSAKVERLDGQIVSGTYLHCENAYSKRGCLARRVSYDPFEYQCISFMVFLLQQDFFKAPDEPLANPRSTISAYLDAKLAEIESVAGYMEKTPGSEALLNRMVKLEKERDALRVQLRSIGQPVDAQQVIENHGAKFWRMMELRSVDRKSEEYLNLRRELQVGLRTVVSRIDFQHMDYPGPEDKEYYRITFNIGGKEVVKDWLYTRPPKGFQKGNAHGAPFATGNTVRKNGRRGKRPAADHAWKKESLRAIAS